MLTLTFSVHPRKCKTYQCAKASFILVSYFQVNLTCAFSCLKFTSYVLLSAKIWWQVVARAVANAVQR